MTTTTGRSKTRQSRRADSLFGYMIPFFFVCLAGYQEIHDHAIDKYVIGALLVFGLGALGWRIDTLFERYVEARALSTHSEGPHASHDSE